MAECESLKRKKKVMVIGLDGATFDVLDPLCRKGKMPNLTKIMEKGVRARLVSTIPPVTGPAWVSFMTGKNPGKHGIFDFVKKRDDGFGRQIVSSKDIASKTIWNILSENDRRVGIVNVPITYPPPKVNGFVVSGMLTPGLNSEFTYPACLHKQIKEHAGEYVLDVWWESYGIKRIKEFLRQLKYCSSQRAKASLYLMRELQGEFFMTVFIGTDRIQHALWEYIFREISDLPFRSEKDKEIRHLIVNYYEMLDGLIGQLVRAWGKDSNFIVMSDHGFGALEKEFYVNTWLEKLGLLRFDWHRIRKQKIKRGIVSGLKKLDPLNLRKKLLCRLDRPPARMRAYDFLESIKWSDTKAYSVSNTEQGIHLNRRNREQHGIVDSGKDSEEVIDFIIEQLKQLRDPKTNEKLVSRVHRKEDLYRGRQIAKAPDLVFLLQEGSYPANAQPKTNVFERANWATGYGTHRTDGVFIACGKDICRGKKVERCHIVDLAPTILNLLGVPIPDDMDGRVLDEIFLQEFRRTNPAEYITMSGDEAENWGEKEVYSEEEAAAIEEKLRGLGYMG